METLWEVQNYLNEIDYINSGGCGISAYSMYLWLKKNNLINSSFRFVLCYKDYCENSYLNNSNVLRDKLGKAVAPNHMVIFYDGKYIDSEGTVNISKYSWIQHVEEEWFIINCLNNIDTWNDCFDRINIRKIEKDLGIKLKGIKRTRRTIDWF